MDVTEAGPIEAHGPKRELGSRPERARDGIFGAMDIIPRPDTQATLCAHAPAVVAEPRAGRCEECGSGFNLRSCTACGHVGCCESQAGHARAHALEQHHPVIEQMASRGPGWAWCYEEKRYIR